MAQINDKSIEVIKDCLTSFCHLSGQSINKAKSKIIIFEHCPKPTQAILSQILMIRVSNSFGKYLGFPITSSKPRVKDFQFVLDNMISRLSTWKSNLLSMAGRCTLATSCLNCLPNHLMKYTLLPAKILSKIDKIQRDFIWGTNGTSKNSIS